MTILNVRNSDSNALFSVRLDAASFQVVLRYCKAVLEPLLQTTAKNKLFECQKKSQIIRVNSVTVVRRYLYFKYMRTRKQSGMMARRIDDPIYQLLRRVLGRTVLMHGRGLIMRVVSFCSVLFALPPYTISVKRSEGASIN